MVEDRSIVIRSLGGKRSFTRVSNGTDQRQIAAFTADRRKTVNLVKSDR